MGIGRVVAAPMGDKVKASSNIDGAATLFLTKPYLDAFKKLISEVSSAEADAVSSIVTADRVDIDMLITDVTEVLAEHTQLVSYLGDSYKVDYFGKAPSILNITLTLLDSEPITSDHSVMSAKYRFMWLYHNIFSITAVTTHGIIPCLQIADTTYYGAFLAVDFTESSDRADIVQGAARFLILNKVTVNTNNSSGLVRAEVLYDEDSCIGKYGHLAENDTMDKDSLVGVVYSPDNTFSGYRAPGNDFSYTAPQELDYNSTDFKFPRTDNLSRKVVA